MSTSRCGQCGSVSATTSSSTKVSIVKPAELVNRQSDDTLNNADTNRRIRPTSIGFRPFSSALIDRLQRVNVWRWLHASNNHACRRRAPTNFKSIRDKIDMHRGYPVRRHRNVRADLIRLRGTGSG